MANAVSLLDCIIIKDVFQFEDVTISPAYDKYPDNVLTDKCTYNLVFFGSCIGYTGIPTMELDSSLTPTITEGISNSTSVVYYVSITSKMSTNEVNSNIILSGCGYSGTDAIYPLRFQCHPINITELVFKQTKVFYNSFLSYHAFIKVEGNKYPINFINLYSVGKDEYYANVLCLLFSFSTDSKITNNCTVEIPMVNQQQITLTFESYFKNSQLNLLGSVKTYPDFTTINNFVQTGYYSYPQMIINFKSDLIAPFFEVFTLPSGIDFFYYPLYSESDGSINYLIELKSTGTNKNTTLYYQQNDYATIGFNSLYTIKLFSIPLIPFSNSLNVLQPNIFSFSTLITNNYTKASMKFSTSHIAYGEDFPFPFGITKSLYGFLDYEYNPAFIVSNLYRSLTFGLLIFNQNTKTYNFSGIDIVDLNPPVIINVDLISVYYQYSLIRIEASDDSGLSTFEANNQEYSMARYLVSGNINNGIFEIPLFQSLSSFKIYDIYGNVKSVAERDYYSLNPIKQFGDTIKGYFNSSLISISFDHLEMDVTNSTAFNTMYISLDQSLTEAAMFVQFFSDGGFENVKNGYIPQYDQVKQLYYINFSVKKNSMTGPLDFVLYVSPYSNYYSSDMFEQNVNIISKSIDTVGPFITNILKLPSSTVDLNLNSSQEFGWEITIEDQYNGFSHGFIVVNGLIDGAIYNFTLNSDNGNSFKLLISNVSCVSQTYQINKVILYDNAGRYSYFDRYGFVTTTFTGDYRANPLMKYLGDDSYIQINVACLPTIDDQTVPVLVSITPNVSTIDVGANNRAISFEFEVSDPETGINTNQLPSVYITSLYFSKVECKSYLKSCSSYNCIFKCEVELPLGFGYPNDLYYQVYGIWNKNGMLAGYNFLDIKDTFLSTYILNISTTYSRDIPVITETNRYTSLDKELLLIGKAIGNSKHVNVLYENGTLIKATPKCNYSSYCFVPVEKIYSPFTIQIETNDNQFSNVYKVIPTIVSIKENTNSSSSSSSSSSNNNNSDSLEQCPGTLVCGGSSKGFCTPKGCVCYEPWLGDECQYKTIIVPQPSFNGSDPNITIIVPSENNSQQVEFTSLTSIISLREFNITNNEIGSYRFKTWVNNQINSTYNEYYSNFTNINNSDKTTQVKVSIQWFEKQTNISFAGNSLSMSPSSIKYTIQIKDYPFKSKLNQLQIVMSALFKSNKDNKDICSNKQFGNTKELEDSNYLKIQVGDHSLYARFIKRGIIDSNTVTLTNTLLDSSFKSIEESNELQSFVGITIQSFENEAIIDPDFSVILDSTPDDNCNSSGLSKAQLAGIIIGSVCFVAGAIICVTYFILQKKEKIHFENKLRSLSSRN